MKRRFWAVGLAALVMACADTPLPLEVSAPSLAISDGAHGGNPHFFWVQPMAPEPSEFPGVFDPELLPTVTVSELSEPESAVCIDQQVIRTFGPEIFLDHDERYAALWRTEEDDLTNGSTYRICAHVGSRSLGYRDVRPIDTDSDELDVTQPTMEFRNGRILWIKFRIEEGALCDPGAVDCGAEVIGEDGGTAVCQDAQCGLEIPEDALTETRTFIVQIVPCPRDPDGRVNYLPIDLPQFPTCLDISSEGSEDFTGFAIEAVAGACVDAPELSHEQFHRLQLHHQKTDGTVEALPNRPAGFLHCEEPIGAGAWNRLWHYARRGLRAAQYVVGPWVAPRPLNATDRGFGGATFDESPFVWALPAQMAKVAWTNPEVAVDGAGTDMDVTVLVTDAGGDSVSGARVTFEVTQGDGPPVGPVSVWTGEDGMARLPTWTLGPAGINRLLATGRGIGVSAAEGGSGPFADHVASPVDLGLGELTYEAYACPAARPLSQADGQVSPAEYAHSASFTANISGGSTGARLYWANDCHNVYMALEVEAPLTSTNEWMLVFDNDHDGAPEVGDDLWNVQRGASTGQAKVLDLFLTATCVRGSVVRCGTGDTFAPGGTNDLHGEALGFNADRGVTTFELRHPLQGDLGHDFQVDIRDGGTVGMFLALQLGTGAAGYTEWPGFRVFLPITLSVP
jgi:hypothetical protein